MPYNPYAHHRQTARLRTWDYARGGVAYFVTICAYARACLFGDVTDGELRMSEAGRIAAEEWLRSGELRPWLELDAFVVMPNHLHGIVLLHAANETDEAAMTHDSPQVGGPRRADRSLGSFIRGYKGAVTARINTAGGSPGMPIWQRNYYDHIIRNDDDLQRIRAYIADNPARWDSDRENPLGPQEPRLPRS